MTNELTLIENKTAIEIFSEKNGLDEFLNKIKEDVKSIHTDASTPEGREAIRSLAVKVRASKTTLKKMGDDLGADYKIKYDAIRLEKNRGVAELQVLQDEVRKPLTDFENKEKDRVARLSTAIDIIDRHDFFDVAPSIDEVDMRLSTLNGLYETPDWEEFAERARLLYKEKKDNLSKLKNDIKKHEEEQVELERLRAEEQVRKQKERDEQIAKEATERAEKEAKDKADEEAQRVADEQAKNEKLAQNIIDQQKLEKEQVEQKLKDTEVKAKQDLIDAEKEAEATAKKAKKDKEEAIKRIQNQIDADKKEEAEATAKRESDLKHTKKINNEALADLSKIVTSEDFNSGNPLKKILGAIANGKIKHVSIKY